MIAVLVAAVVAVFGAYSLVVVVDAARVGLPRWPERKPRMCCDVYGCRSSFFVGDSFNSMREASIALELHQKAAHGDELDKQLWPHALPVRNRDFSTRQARIMQHVDHQSDRDVVLVNGVKVKMLRGGNDARARTSRSK